MTNMFTKTQLRKALKKAHWRAMHDTRLEYRVEMFDDDESVYVSPWLQGDNSWHMRATVLKKFCFWPSINDYWAGGPVDAITYKFMQGEYIRNQLEYDVESIMDELEQRGVIA